ncbi:M20 aminoacylase family protein [Kordiimonas gwangyangensis]|uniref:M20 aminoacylase family protein n=1 Tax=Kordiimonas gwangyangensis TaxID=288022 RepID=UPI00035CC29D
MQSDRVLPSADEITAWRRYLHSRPELAFDEVHTATFIAEKLREFGCDVHTGIAETGVVGILGKGLTDRAIGLRADMDALPITETNDFPHRSQREGCMHACGHDGHMAMLLAAARELASGEEPDGRIYFIFQPAEEGAGGGAAMIRDGLFDRFPMEAVFGLHNVPGLEAGSFATRTGPIMAALDLFDIRIAGRGGHAAFPQNSSDVIVAAGALISVLQTIISRNVSPADAAVLSVTAVEAGKTYNVLPDTASLKGAIRSFTPEVRTAIIDRVLAVCRGVAEAYGVSIESSFEVAYPATINSERETLFASEVAQDLFGTDGINGNCAAQMASEDFAFMLQERPGCYMLIGNGSRQGGCLLHSSDYDFNDAILENGAQYWVALAKAWLARSSV